jgi:hypothetical protein
LERAVIRGVSGDDIKGFNRVVTSLEQEAHERVSSRGKRRGRERKKPAV